MGGMSGVLRGYGRGFEGCEDVTHTQYQVEADEISLLYMHTHQTQSRSLVGLWSAVGGEEFI